MAWFAFIFAFVTFLFMFVFAFIYSRLQKQVTVDPSDGMAESTGVPLAVQNVIQLERLVASQKQVIDQLRGLSDNIVNRIRSHLAEREDGALTRDGLRQELEKHRDIVRKETEAIVSRGLRLCNPRPPDQTTAAASESVVGEDENVTCVEARRWKASWGSTFHGFRDSVPRAFTGCIPMLVSWHDV